MNEYFCAPEMCQSKGGAYNFVCEHHAVRTGRKSVCLYKKTWQKIGYRFKCPNKEWQKNRVGITQ